MTAVAMEDELDRLPLNIMTPEEQLITGDPRQDIELLVYHLCPEIVPARDHVDPVVHQLMSLLTPNQSTEQEDEVIREFLPTIIS